MSLPRQGGELVGINTLRSLDGQREISRMYLVILLYCTFATYWTETDEKQSGRRLPPRQIM
jgi:hypothetical protein